MYIRGTLEERLTARLIPNNGCLEWIGYSNKSGYGMIWDKDKNRMVLTHRAAFSLKQELPEDVLLRHTCDNPPCCLFDHLLPGDHQDNSNDKYARNREYHLKGSENGRAIITEDTAAKIRELYATGKFYQKHLASMFDIDQTSISRIVLRKSWKHI